MRIIRIMDYGLCSQSLYGVLGLYCIYSRRISSIHSDLIRLGAARRRRYFTLFRTVCTVTTLDHSTHVVDRSTYRGTALLITRL